MYSFVEPFRDGKTAEQVIKYIKQETGTRKIRIVQVCGTHENTIFYPRQYPLFNQSCNIPTRYGADKS